MLHTALHWDQRFISLKNENGKSVITHSLKGKIVCKWACLKGQREIIRSGFFEYKEENTYYYMCDPPVSLNRNTIYQCQCNLI